MAGPRILIVEDEAIIAEDLKRRLENLTYTVVDVASTCTQAVQKTAEHRPDMILMDIVLKGERDGIEAAGIIRKRYGIPVIYLTAYSDEEILERASVTAPYGYLVKPFKDREVHASIQMALSKSKLEKRVKESRDWFAATLKCIGEGVIVTNQRGAVTFLNTMAQEMTGWELDEAVGRPLQEIFTVFDTDEPVADHPAIAEGRLAEYSFPTKKGEIKYLSGVLLTRTHNAIPFEDSFSAIHADDGQTTGSVVVFRDITLKKKAEEQKAILKAKLHQSQKMEAIGTLAGGIAHDFNNLLSVIMGYADLLLVDVPENSDHRECLEEILTAGYRARDLIKQILSFSRQREADSVVLIPGPIVKENLKLLRSSIPANIEIRQRIDVLCGPIRIDPTLFSQVVINLCTNAYLAMEKQYGILNVKMEQVILDKIDTDIYPDAAPGAYVNLSISDTGVGISPDIMDRIFEPYFTTREQGKGTGLGLATVHGIVKANYGLIKVDSKPGEGTCVQVFLPVTEGRAASDKEYEEQVPFGTERILLVDDEKTYVRMGKMMLERLGYSVIAKSNAIEALEIFSNQPESFDLVITDQTMPKMTGEDLARKLLQIRPGIPIILCTGFSETVSKKKAKTLGIREYAFKPLVKKDFARLIRKVLDV